MATVQPIPEAYPRVIPYLTVDGADAVPERDAVPGVLAFAALLHRGNPPTDRARVHMPWQPGARLCRLGHAAP